MNDTVILILAGPAGAALGGIFFGGLWWTVRRGLASAQPARWFLVSSLLRVAITLAGFYFVAGGQWQRLVACLVGFVAARFAVTRLTRPADEKQTGATKEISHAP